MERFAERLASTRGGRATLSVLIIALIAATATWNLPPGAGPAGASGGSALRDDVLDAGGPLLYALGLDQNWGVFAPPRTYVLALEARIGYADGSQTIWRPPVATGDLIGAYRDYRWGKYVENGTADVNAHVLWQPLAAWVARRYTSPGRRPVSVSLIRRFYELLPVGAGSRSPRGPWWQFTYYVYRVPAVPTR